MRPFAALARELVRAAWHRRLDAALLELAIANEEASLAAGDFESARAVWGAWPVRWARRHFIARRHQQGFSDVTIEAELDIMRTRVRRELAAAERALRDRRP